MKKYYFMMAAVSAMMLTACSSEDDVLLADKAQPTVENSAVGFDVYTPAATNATRSGRTNVMDNPTLQKTGFGVFGYQDDGDGALGEFGSSSTPNFMYNQQVNYISNAWGYSPLKYWPNETVKDSQSTPAEMPEITGTNLDVLSFFAYAPWVKATPTSGAPINIYPNEADLDKSITLLPTNATTGDPKISYTVATDPSQSVDLLWGVAPVGGLSYKAVDGETVPIEEGMPLVNLKKPAVNTSMKFLFQHALARLGVKVVLAADQVSAGGTFDVANNKVTIESIVITGNFHTEGKLNLNNTAPKTPLWQDVVPTVGTPAEFTINATKGLAAHLRFDSSKGPDGTPAQQEVTGVTTQLADAIQVSNIPGYTKQSTDPAYSPIVPYFSAATDNETPNYARYNNWLPNAATTYLQKNVLSEAYTDITGTINTKYPKATVWQDIYSIASANIIAVAAGNVDDCQALKAYRLNGTTYYPTGQAPTIGDYVFVKNPADLSEGDATATELAEVTAPTTTTDYYFANSNYFMLIPPIGTTTADKTIKVKITYYVSTTDPNVVNGVVYTKNEVEKEIELPSFKNGVAYNLKLILGLTSVKLEAEAVDWVTTTSEINLPQNISE